MSIDRSVGFNPDIIAEQAKIGSIPILKDAVARGASLYRADREGNVFERTADGLIYAVTLVNNRLVRRREITR